MRETDLVEETRDERGVRQARKYMASLGCKEGVVAAHL